MHCIAMKLVGNVRGKGWRKKSYFAGELRKS
jgi:hypothetical protein